MSKKVTFHPIAEIILIPPYSELEYYRDLWWTNEDKYLAHQSALYEIRRLMYIHPSMKFSQAKNLLYQRRTIEYRPEYFSDTNAETVTK
jgi:hypothetical protein